MSKRPEWLDNAVFYEVYPQSFKDTDGDGIGNINGITEKLPYIKDLGCTAIWINPCFCSPFGDAGYDVSDYCKVAPRYGTNDDLIHLFEEAHKLDMHILLDLVPGHTSWKHPWFIESMKAERNEYTDRYVWTDSIWEEPTGYGSLRGISDRDGSCAVNFFTHQPALNYGFYKPNIPWQQSMDSDGTKATREAMKKLTAQLPSLSDIPRSEPYPVGPSHYNDLFRCDAPFFGGNGDASAFVAKYVESYERSERKGLICIPSGNHDMDRLAKHIHGDDRKLAFAFLLSMPGAPYIYYGDEIGMRYVEGLISVEGGYGRTGSRSPMQWDDSDNAGFSTAPVEKLYIPIDPADDRPTVQAQMNDSSSLRNEVKRLISIRQSYKALQSLGEIEFISDGAKGRPLAYIRSYENERILVVIDPTENKNTITFDGAPSEVIYRFGREVTIRKNRIALNGKTAVFIRI